MAFPATVFVLSATCANMITDDTSFTNVYKHFSVILIAASEKSYGRVVRRPRKTDSRISTPDIEKMVACLRSIGGAIRFINAPESCSLSHGAWITYLRIIDIHSALDDATTTLAECARRQRKKTYRELYRTRSTEIRARKQRLDRARISSALRGGSTKRLIHPGEFIELPIAVNPPHSDSIVSDPEGVKKITREYWSKLYTHEPTPTIPKPWLTTKSVLDIKERSSESL
ncbi:hypothetical protein B0H10DRAFT_2235745 [Mycena sp. CBHHK59/15]|nr:hypothetical protein B0H10DRAFT_2235745 [Mycena sp. CBHHK59/15]